MLELKERDMTLFLKAECIQVPQGISFTQRAYLIQILKLFCMTDY